MNPILPIILIGPMATGKSTVADELSKLLGIPRIPMDRVRWYYYLKSGFSLSVESTFSTFTEKMAYWKPYEVTAVKKITAEFSDSIIDFGAGHSYFPNESHFRTVQEHLANIKNIFLLLPSEDKTESLKICNEKLKDREGREFDEHQINANRWFIEHPSNYLLSKQIIYTMNQTPNETARQIISFLR